ncbi:MAG: hypothetical protein AAF632_17425 [Bacteroidota bacterium]
MAHFYSVKAISFSRAELLLKSAFFWKWYIGNVLAIVVLLSIGFEMNTINVTVLTTITFAVLCPTAFTLLRDQIMKFPILNDGISNLLHNIQISLDVEVANLFNDGKIDGKIAEIAKANSFFDIRSTAFAFILNIPGKTLRRSMIDKIEKSISRVEELVKKGDRDRDTGDQLKKIETLRLYLRFLYYIYGKKWERILNSSGLIVPPTPTHAAE